MIGDRPQLVRLTFENVVCPLLFLPYYFSLDLTNATNHTNDGMLHYKFN